MATLGEVCAINPALGRSVRDDLLVSFVPMQAVDERTGSIQRPVEARAGDIRSGRTPFAEGDVIFAKITPSMQNGKSAVARGLVNGIAFGSTEFHVLRPNSDVLAEWVHAFLRRDDVLADAARAFTGSAGQQRVPASFLASLQLPVPPIAKQRQIVAHLTEWIAVVEQARSATLERARRVADLHARVLDGAFQAARENSINWPIGSVTRIQTGYAFKSDWFRPRGERLLRNVNIGHQFVDWADTANLDPGMVGQFDAFRLSVGDVVLSLDRPLVGSGIKVARVGPADLPALLLQRVARFITSPSLDAAFLYFFLLSSAFVDAIGGHDQSLGVPHVSPRQVGAVLIPLPSVGEQRRIAGSLHERLATIDAMNAAVDVQLEAFQALRSALLRVVFDGASA